MAKKSVFVFYSSMKITPYNSNNINPPPSFSGKRLLSVALRKTVNGVSESVPAYFTRLTKDDTNLMYDIQEPWRYTSFAGIIFQDFIRTVQEKSPLYKGNLFFMIESPKIVKNIGGVRTLAEVSRQDGDLYVEYIQSASVMDYASKITGGGSFMMYGLSKLAEKLKLNNIRLTSAYFDSDDWYRKLGFKPCGYSNPYEFILPKNEFKAFQEKIKSRFM